MNEIRKFSIVSLLLIFMTVNANTVVGACGCNSDFTESSSFQSYLWQESEGRFTPILVKNVGGQAVFEGDVILGTTAEMKALAKAIEMKVLPKAIGTPLALDVITAESLGPRFKLLIDGHRNEQSAWANNIVPYSFDEKLLRTGRGNEKYERLKVEILRSITLWENGTGLDFQDVTSSTSPPARRIRFKKTTDDCYWNGTTAAVGESCVRHEIGHALGLAHEQNRNGRDAFVTVNRANIEKGHCSQFKESKSTSNNSGPYDFSSIMHYKSDFFSCNDKPTLTAVAPNVINRTNIISVGDFQAVMDLHGIRRPTASLNSFNFDYSLIDMISATRVVRK